MAISDLSRFEQFLATPVEDVESRSMFTLTEAELGELHNLAVKGQVSWDFYHKVNNALKADFIFCESGKDRDWTVAYIRKQLGRTAYRHYTSDGEDIDEWISGRLWPKGWHIERIRSRKDPLRVIHEVELAFSPNADLEGLWKRQRSGFEEEAIELLQKFPENEFVHSMCFLPGAQNFTVRIVLSAGRKRKDLTFPIALKYEPLLRTIAKEYTLDDTPLEPEPDTKETLQRPYSEELQEVLRGLWSAVRKYEPSKDIPIPKYVENQLGWHMGEEFKRRSTEIDDPETGKRRRVLKAKMDRTGGSLDDPIQGKDGAEAGTLADTISDPNAKPPDKQILIQQILGSLVDDTDKKIVRLRLKGHSQDKIGKDLKMTQEAIAKRLKAMGKRLSR